MGDVVNLRQARKTRQRADEARQAEANRAKHGRPKAEKQMAEAERRKLAATVDGARLDSERDSRG